MPNYNDLIYENQKLREIRNFGGIFFDLYNFLFNKQNRNQINFIKYESQSSKLNILYFLNYIAEDSSNRYLFAISSKDMQLKVFWDSCSTESWRAFVGYSYGENSELSLNKTFKNKNYFEYIKQNKTSFELGKFITAMVTSFAAMRTETEPFF